MALNTAACCAEIIPLKSPWWRRALDAWREHRNAREHDDPYAGLRHLSEETLRDIGAPGYIRDDAAARDRWLLDTRNW